MNPKLLNLQIIQVYELDGTGQPEDPYRRNRCWYTTDGLLIAKEDAHSKEFNQLNMDAINWEIKI